MRVAHLTTVDTSLRFLLLPQLRAVVDAGGEVTGISAPGSWSKGLERDGVRHVALASSTRGMDVVADLRSARELFRVLRRGRFDVLHTHNPKPGLYGRVIGRLAGVPIIVNTVHGLYATEDDGWPKRLLVYLLEAVASRFSDAELVQNPEDLELMSRWRITRRARLLGNGVDLERFDPGRFAEETRRELRRSLGAGPDHVVVGTVGRLVAEKGYEELFEAVARLAGDARFVPVAVGPGDPEKADRLGAQAFERATRLGVRLLGWRDDVDALYRAMDVFVLPSHREGFPRAAMEAAAMGLPIVASDVRGCRQVVEHEVNGLLVPLGDAGALAGALRRLGDDPSLRAAMGAAGRRRARDEFDERAVVRTVMDTYREVAARKGVNLGL